MPTIAFGLVSWKRGAEDDDSCCAYSFRRADDDDDDDDDDDASASFLPQQNPLASRQQQRMSRHWPTSSRMAPQPARPHRTAHEDSEDDEEDPCPCWDAESDASDALIEMEEDDAADS